VSEIDVMKDILVATPDVFEGRPLVRAAINHGRPSPRQRQYYRARDYAGSATPDAA